MRLNELYLCENDVHLNLVKAICEDVELFEGMEDLVKIRSIMKQAVEDGDSKKLKALDRLVSQKIESYSDSDFGGQLKKLDRLNKAGKLSDDDFIAKVKKLKRDAILGFGWGALKKIGKMLWNGDQRVRSYALRMNPTGMAGGAWDRLWGNFNNGLANGGRFDQDKAVQLAGAFIEYCGDYRTAQKILDQVAYA